MNSCILMKTYTHMHAHTNNHALRMIWALSVCRHKKKSDKLNCFSCSPLILIYCSLSPSLSVLDAYAFNINHLWLKQKQKQMKKRNEIASKHFKSTWTVSRSENIENKQAIYIHYLTYTHKYPNTHIHRNMVLHLKQPHNKLTKRTSPCKIRFD